MTIYSSNELPGDGHTASPHSESLISTEVEKWFFVSINPHISTIKNFFQVIQVLQVLISSFVK